MSYRRFILVMTDASLDLNHTPDDGPWSFVPPSGEQSDAGNGSPPKSLLAHLEALLFVAPSPATPAQLAAALEVSLGELEAALQALEKRYLNAEMGYGIRLQRYRGRVQLTSAPESAAFVERFLGLESSSRLSRAALETLAIILYRQPITRPQIDAIRGVNSDGVLKGLLLKGLVQEVGRAELPGRPILYSATPECLQYFGLNSLAELPPLDLDEPSAPASLTGDDDQEGL